GRGVGAKQRGPVRDLGGERVGWLTRAAERGGDEQRERGEHPAGRPMRGWLGHHGGVWPRPATSGARSSPRQTSKSPARAILGRVAQCRRKGVRCVFGLY